MQCNLNSIYEYFYFYFNQKKYGLIISNIVIVASCLSELHVQVSPNFTVSCKFIFMDHRLAFNFNTYKGVQDHLIPTYAILPVTSHHSNLKVLRFKTNTFYLAKVLHVELKIRIFVKVRS